jgi:anti-sigma B factor antagonist
MLCITHNQTAKGRTVCCPNGDLDAFTVDQFRQALADLSGPRGIIIDLSATAFIDSAGLGALIGGIRRTRELGGDVAVACSRPALIRLLHTTGFDHIVTIASGVHEAENTLRPDPPTDTTDPTKAAAPARYTTTKEGSVKRRSKASDANSAPPFRSEPPVNSNDPVGLGSSSSPLERAANHAMGVELQIEELVEQRERALLQHRQEDASRIFREITELQEELEQTSAVGTPTSGAIDNRDR